MDAPAVDCKPQRGRIEVLILQLAQRAAVHSVGHVGPETRHVKEIRAAADLLVRREPDQDIPMGDLRMREEVRGHFHDFRHARLVVGA